MSTEEKKIHKLLIELETEVPKSYKTYLKPSDLVRGEEAKLRFHVTNISEEEFSGGVPAILKISEIGSASGTGMLETSVLEKELLEMRVTALEHGQRQTLKEYKFVPTIDGMIWVELLMKLLYVI